MGQSEAKRILTRPDVLAAEEYLEKIEKLDEDKQRKVSVIVSAFVRPTPYLGDLVVLLRSVFGKSPGTFDELFELSQRSQETVDAPSMEILANHLSTCTRRSEMREVLKSGIVFAVENIPTSNRMRRSLDINFETVKDYVNE